MAFFFFTVFTMFSFFIIVPVFVLCRRATEDPLSAADLGCAALEAQLRPY